MPADTLFSGAEPCIGGMKPSASGRRAAASTTALFNHHHPARRNRDGAEADSRLLKQRRRLSV